MSFERFAGDGGDPTLDVANRAKKTVEQFPWTTHYTPVENLPITVVVGTPGKIEIAMLGYTNVSVQPVKTSGGTLSSLTMNSAGNGAVVGSAWKDSTQYGWTCTTAAPAASYGDGDILFSKPGCRAPGHQAVLTATGTDWVGVLAVTRWNK